MPQTSQIEAAQKLGKYVATGLEAKKIIFLSQQAQQLEDVVSQTRVTYDEFDRFYEHLLEINLGGFEDNVRFVKSLLEGNVSEIAFLFGVSISTKLEKMLLPLGFKEVQRSALPQTWQDQYDTQRSSRAFALTF
ncbi:MAG: hypothetical protein OEV07_01165 [Gammaproteobacteria bacterium]|nr:hypothetical protein [Gammaproteobacteria bacterium]